MRTLYAQVIASTSVDSHGDSIPVERLRELFEAIPDPWVMCDNHDPSKPPTCRSYNKQFVQLPDGHWAICSDVDVFDEEKFAEYGGFSIAFRTTHFTVNPEREPEIEVTINPRLFPLDEFKDLARRSTSELQLDVRDLIQKSLDVPAIVFLSFAAGAIASGFFKAVGTDLYGLLKKKIKECGKQIEEKHGADLKCNMTFEIQHRDKPATALVTVRSADLDVLAERGISAESIVDHVKEVAKDVDLQKVVVRVSKSEPMLIVDYYTDSAGIVHKPTQ